MAKNKKKNVFKVTGAKSLHVKKAKNVTSQLKNISHKHKTKEAVRKIDKDLINLQEKVRTSKGDKNKANEQKKKNSNSKSIVKSINEQAKDFKQMQEDSSQVVANLENVQLK